MTTEILQGDCHAVLAGLEAEFDFALGVWPMSIMLTRRLWRPFRKMEVLSRVVTLALRRSGLRRHARRLRLQNRSTVPAKLQQRGRIGRRQLERS